MNRNRTKRANLALLLLAGLLATGCEEWWGEEEDLDAAVDPGTMGDAAADSGGGQLDANVPDAGPLLDSALPVDSGVIIDTGVADATVVLDSAADASTDAGQPDAAMADAGQPDAAPGTELPCDVKQVLQTRCQGCHGNPPVGAPIALVTLADLTATSAAGGPVYERVQLRIDSTTSPMPPTYASTGALTQSEKETLTNWIANDAPGSNGVCP